MPQQGHGDFRDSKGWGIFAGVVNALAGAGYAAGVSGATQNPWAGPQALGQIRMNGMRQEAAKMAQAAQKNATDRQTALRGYMEQNHGSMSTPEEWQLAIADLNKFGAYKDAKNMTDQYNTLFGAEAKVPTTRTVYEGNERVQQEYNAASGEWFEVGRGTAASGTTVNVNPAKNWEKESQKMQYDSLVAQGVDQGMARDVVKGDAFEIPMLGKEGRGRYVRGKGEFRNKVLGLVSFQETVSRVEDAAQRVADEHGETGRGTQFVAWLDKMATGAPTPAISNYQQIKSLAVAEFIKAMSGAQASDKERAFLTPLFPNLAELVGDDGQVSETARNKITEWRSRAIDYVLSNMDASERPAARKAYHEIYGGGAMLPGDEDLLGGDITEEQIEEELRLMEEEAANAG
jgi:hypothetical protein